MKRITPVVNDIKSLRKRVQRWRRQGLKVALVPTMGALHEGHLSLIDAATKKADRVIASIYINPTQFAAGEDLSTYPRDEIGDLTKLKSRGTNLAYVPDNAEMYPDGFATTVSVSGPANAGLEDKYRPDFFDGVATIVAKLLIQARCDMAVFGEKDYQQLLVITRMTRDLNIPTSIFGATTIREPDGLAMSSRNIYLSEKHRKNSPLLHSTLQHAAQRLRDGDVPKSVMASAKRALTKGGFKVDYVEARNAQTLAKLGPKQNEPIRLLAAAQLGKTRLIDNIAV
jgi:pantoate--beta-alanine ligase